TLLICLGLTGWLAVGVATAQEPDANSTDQGATAARKAAPSQAKPAKAAGEVGRGSLMQLVRQANPMLWPLVVCSVVTLGFALERGIALRRRRVVPRDFAQRFLDRLSSGKLDRDRAAEMCRANESPVSRVFGYVVRYWGQPAATIRQGLEHDAAG